MSILDNLAAKFASMTNQYVVGGGLQGISEGSQKQTNRYMLNEENNYSYFNFLEPYNFSSSITSIFSSIATEALDRNNLSVKIKNSDDTTIANLNDTLANTNIKAKLIDDMGRLMWRGKYGYGIDKETCNLVDIRDPYKLKVVTRMGELLGYVYQNKYFTNNEMIGYWYDRYPVKAIKMSDKLKEVVEKDNSSPLMKYFIEFATFTGKSIFSDQLIRIFQMYCLEYLLFMLSIREAVKPEMLSLTYGSKLGDLAYGTGAAKNLESLLNAPTTGLANLIDPIAFVNKLTMSILNYVRVIPNLDSYDGVRSIDMPDLQSKKNKANEDYENARKQVLNNLTIPEEVYGGNSNRWEAVGRNDRFMTTNQKIVSSISRFVKHYVVSVCKIKFDLDIKFQDVEYSIDLSNFTSMYDVRNKIQAVSDKAQVIENLFMSFNNLLNNFPWVDRAALTEYMEKQISSIDEGLGKVINKNAAVNPPAPPAEDSDKDGIPNTMDSTPWGQYQDGRPKMNPDAAMRDEMNNRR